MEHRVIRRNDPTLITFEQVLAESERLLAVYVQEHPGSEEKVESLYRQLLSQRLPRMLEHVHTTHFTTPSVTHIRTLEHHLKLAESESIRHKEDRVAAQMESFEKSSCMQRERQEILTREKVLEIKLSECQLKLQVAEKKVKAYQQKEYQTCPT